ncbi:MAG: hypothetical protein ABI920_13425 [Casimicrobiaceae bacterium]
MPVVTLVFMKRRKAAPAVMGTFMLAILVFLSLTDFALRGG